MTPNGPSLRGAVDLSSLTRASVRPGSAELGEGVSGSRLIIDGTDTNFSAIVELSRTLPVVVEVWAAWSEPSSVLSPILERITREYNGRIVLARVEVDANPGLAQAFQAQSVPIVLALLAGQPVPLFAGAVTESQVRDVFDQVLVLAEQSGVTGSVPVEGDEPVDSEVAPLNPHHQAAFDAIEAADYPAAVTAYRAALAENPRDADATAGLAQVSLLARLHGKTLDGIRNAAAASPENLDAQLDVADLDLSGGHIEDAFGRVLDLFAVAQQEDRARIRERLLELFEVVGQADPRVNAARARLSSLLY